MQRGGESQNRFGLRSLEVLAINLLGYRPRELGLLQRLVRLQNSRDLLPG